MTACVSRLARLDAAVAARPGAHLQTAPGKGWNVILRLHGPLQPWFDQTWRPGEIELVR